MPVTPKDIVDKVFTKSFRGYDEEEVDLFLDEIIKEMEKQMHENNTLRLKVDELTLKLGMLYASLENQKGNMAKAQSKAQEYLNNTNIKSRLIVEQAQRKARDIVLRADEAAKARMAEAEKQAKRVIQDAELESSRLQAQLDREAIGLASPYIFTDLRKKQQELELLTMKIERGKTDLQQLQREGEIGGKSGDSPSQAENELPPLDFYTLDISQASEMPPPMPPGYAIGMASNDVKLAEGEAPEQPAEAEAEEARAGAGITAQSADPPEETRPRAEDWLADEAALLELLPPGWDNLEGLSDDELNILMKALGIPLE